MKVGWQARDGLWLVCLLLWAEPALGRRPASVDDDSVLSPLQLETVSGLFLQRYSGGEEPFRVSSTSLGVGLGFGLGLFEAFEIGLGAGFIPTAGPALGLPVVLAPRPALGDVQLYGMYALDSWLESVLGPRLCGAARLVLNLPVATDFHLILDAPLRLRVFEGAALRVTPALGFGVGDINAFVLGLELGALVRVSSSVVLTFDVGSWGQLGRAGQLLVPARLEARWSMLAALDLAFEGSLIDLNTGLGWWMLQAKAIYRVSLSAR